MSVVSGVTLQIDVGGEEFSEQDSGHDIVPIIDKINEWLAAKGFGQIMSVEDHYGGSKHPQVFVYGAGFNYFPEDEFAAFVMDLPWGSPENCVLLITPENGPTRIFRPSY